MVVGDNGNMTLSGTFTDMYRGSTERLFKTASYMFGSETIPDEHSYGTYLFRDYVPQSFATSSADAIPDDAGSFEPVLIGGTTSGSNSSGGDLLFPDNGVLVENQGALVDVPTPIAFGALGLGLLGFSTRRKKVS